MQAIHDSIKYKTQWRIKRYADDKAFKKGQPFSESTIDGNLLLTAGITAMLTLFIGGSETAFSNANARIGVGDSTTAESAAHTDLQASTNKTYKGMSASYPQVAGTTMTFRAVFTGAEANYAWQEFVIDNGSAPAKRINRKVSAQGTKVAGQTWTLDVSITLS
jgi:hypothetical protein